MTESNLTFEKLKSLEILWVRIGRTAPDSAEYRILMAEIRAQSAEYLAILEAHVPDQEPN